jgi:hypothetical protein
VGPTSKGITVIDYVSQGSITTLQQAGSGVTISPHAGAEWEVIHKVVRVRGGTYLEPSRYTGNSRAHGCGGLDLHLPLGVVDLKLGFGADIARDYINLAFSVGLWRESGPQLTVGK